MNEVEKMYSNAGVEKHYCSFESCDGNVYNWELNEDGEEKYNKCFLGKPKIKQRLFTAEKQLELIKWLSTKELKIRTNKQPYAVYVGVLGNDNTCFFGCEGLYFEQTLAEVINHLWQDLTEEERKQIRGILE